MLIQKCPMKDPKEAASAGKHQFSKSGSRRGRYIDKKEREKGKETKGI